MSARFVNLDRQPPMFLPCDLRAWLPADHRGHFLLDAVEQLPTGRFGSRHDRRGHAPRVAVRYRCANHHPAHAAIGGFRTAHRAAFQAACVTGRQLAQQLRLPRVGTVSVAGTKVPAHASKHAAGSYQRAGERIAQMQLEVQERLTRAAPAAPRAAKETLAIPAELARREPRLAALTPARQVIAARAQELAAAQQAEQQARVAARQAPRAAGKTPRGPEPTPPSEVPGPQAQDNFTDPERRIMKAGNGQHFEPADHAQAAGNEVLLIVGQRVSDAPNDQQELMASVAAISPVVTGEVHAVLVGRGFYRAAAVQAVEQKRDGTPRGLTV